MPCELYIVRLIHNLTKRPFPGERLWTSNGLQFHSLCGNGDRLFRQSVRHGSQGGAGHQRWSSTVFCFR